MGALLSPMLDATSSILSLIIYGAVLFIAGIFSIWLWPETNNWKMPETLEEAEHIAQTKND